MPTGGNTTQLSPDAFRTAIDAVVYEKYMMQEAQDYLSARDPFFFRQEQGDEMVYAWDEFSGVGAFEQVDEQALVPNSDAFIGNTKTVRQVKWMKQIPISFEAMKTEQKGINLRQQIGEGVARNAKVSQDRTAVKNTYADAFTGTYTTTPDGDSWASATHTTLKGVNVDNLETAALDADGLWTLVQNLANQKAQDGEPGSQVAGGIVVPYILLKTAHETLDSELAPFGGENQINYFKTVHGMLRIGGTIMLGSTYNSQSNANTSFHLVSDNHQASRRTLTGLESEFVEQKYAANDTAYTRSRFMEAHYLGSWFGYAGSNGTT